MKTYGQEMDTFLTKRGFVYIKLRNVEERVYSKPVTERVSMRVYTGICDGQPPRRSIRVVMVQTRGIGHSVALAGGVTRVDVDLNWRQSLQTRLDNIYLLYQNKRPILEVN